jgi:asparagine synthase (glutamine-hydrolysing)
MCGISGIVNRNNSQVTPEIIKAFNNIIAHRGPDADGFYFGSNFAFGHRRLSILDLSAEGNQPMHYLERYTITYNGEVYNYIEIKEELIKLGYNFKSKTDTEVILAAYAQWGEACVDRFNGMWAFAIYDRLKNIIFCSRDRFGVKPFYYAIIGSYFAFGSEIKQFTVLPQWSAKANIPRVLDFLMYGVFDHSEETLFDEVLQLRGGHNLTYNLHSHQYIIKEWYNLSNKVSDLKDNFDAAKSKFLNLFQDAVKLRLRSDVKVGSCLSGGLDSSAIVSIVNKVLRETNQQEIQETVSSCFEIKKYDEQEYIDAVVDQTQVKAHKVFPKYENLMDTLEKIVWFQDNPIGSSSIYAQYNVFETTAKHNIKVMLDGQGADESLAGYDGFYYSYYYSLLHKLKITTLLNEVSSVRRYNRFSIPTFVYKSFTSFLPYSVHKLLKKKLNSFDEMGIKYKEYKSLGEEEDILINKVLDFSSLRKLSYNQIYEHSLPMLLHYADRMSMAHSIESRLPFLDYRLVEYIFSLQDSFKINQGKTKYILREALTGILPDKIINRYDKMGFVTPEAYWMKNHNQEFYNRLEEATTVLADIIDKDTVLYNFRKDTEKDSVSMGSFYWRVLSVASWFKVFNIKLYN